MLVYQRVTFESCELPSFLKLWMSYSYAKSTEGTSWDFTRNKFWQNFQTCNYSILFWYWHEFLYAFRHCFPICWRISWQVFWNIYTHTCLCVCVPTYIIYIHIYSIIRRRSIACHLMRSGVRWGCTHSLIRSFTNFLNLMSFHFIHSLMHSFIHSVIHSLTCALIQSFVHSFSHFIRSCIPLRQLVQSCNPLIFWSPLLLPKLARPGTAVKNTTAFLTSMATSLPRRIQQQEVF